MRKLPSPFAGTLAREDADHLAPVLRALADPARLQLLSLLHERGEMSAQDLIAGLGRLAQPTVSHHLRLLREAGFIHTRKRAQFVMHSLDRRMFAAVAAVILPGGDR